MTHFIRTNWYRLMLSTSILLFAAGFFVFTLKYNTVQAGTIKSPFTIEKNVNDKYWVVSCGNHIYEVTYNAFMEKYEFKVIGPEQDY